MRLFIGDTETTGLGPDREAIDIALIEIDWDLNILGEAEAMLRPIGAISPEASAVHGITAEQLADKPTFDDWLRDTWGGQIEGECALIGYRIAFDKPMIERMFEQGVSKMLDVLPLTQRHIAKKGPLTPDGVIDHKLQTIREHLKLPGGTAHRAMGDVITTYELLRHLLPLTGRPLAAHLATPFALVHVMPWGKQHAGKLLAEVPASYRDWLLTLDDLEPNLRMSLELIRSTDFNINLRRK